MNQNEAPVGTVARIGHWDNENRIVKVTGDYWRHVTNGVGVNPDEFRAGWDIEHHDWVLCSDELPPEGRVVETRTENGVTGRLKRNGNLWFLADGSMYVYYTPIAWKDVVS